MATYYRRGSETPGHVMGRRVPGAHRGHGMVHPTLPATHRLTAFVLTSAALVGRAAPGQDHEAAPRRLTEADYVRAERLDRRALYGTVKNVLPIPTWLGQRDEFWYRRETASGWEFDIVDATSGHRRPAFDHQAIARALAAASETSVTADHLPFADIAFATSVDAIHFVVGGKVYDCRVTPANCTGGGPALSSGPFEITFATQVPT